MIHLSGIFVIYMIRYLDRDGVCTTYMICTRVSVGLHDPYLSVGLHYLQDPYDQYDLQDL